MRGKLVLLFVLVFLATSCIIVSLPVKAEARTIIVPDDYSVIQEALDNAGAGDTIYVKKGVYCENLIIHTALSLIGEERDNTIIDGRMSDFGSVITITADGVTVAGFTIRNAVDLSASGITLCPGICCCNISGNMITGNSNGIHLISASNNNITGNRVNSNSGVGIMLHGSAPSTLGSHHNNIQGNEILFNSIEGIVLRLNCSYNNITGNNIGYSMREGILLSWAGNNIIIENDLTNCGVGVGDAGYGNTFLHNNFINNIQDSYTSWLDEATGKVVFSGGNWTENNMSECHGEDENSDGIKREPNLPDEENTETFGLMAPSDSSSGSTKSPELASPSAEPSTESQPEIAKPFPTVPVAAVATIAIVVILTGLLVYKKKHKRKAEHL